MKQEIPLYKNLLMQDILKKQTKKNKEIISSFLEYCKITASDNSMKKISNKIILIADTFEKSLDSLTIEDFHKFLILLNRDARATATKNDIKKVLKRFLRWKYKDWNLRFDEFKDLKMNTKNEGRNLSKEDLLTPDEMKFIINSVESLKYKTILLLMQETANRPEELVKIRWKDINFKSNEIKLHSSKTTETRLIPINQSISHLKRYRVECFYNTPRMEDFVFPSPHNPKKHLTTQALSNFLEKLEKRIEFAKHLYPYLWRHSILSNMIKKLSPKVYEMYAGHSLETGMKTYAHLDTDDLKKELFEKVYEIKELSEEEETKLEKRIEQQDKKIEILMRSYGAFQDLLNEIAETGKIPIKIPKQTREESIAIKKELMANIKNA